MNIAAGLQDLQLGSREGIIADSSMVGLSGIIRNLKALLFAGSMLVFWQIFSTVYYMVGVYICCCNKES